MSSQQAEPVTSKRRPYHGSCHCGKTRYIAYLTLPPTVIDSHATATSTVRIRKCNCSTCHKAGIFHVRLQDSPNDFVLLSPLNPEEALSDYRCFEAKTHWYFCGDCGVRCFAFRGEAEVREQDVEGELKQIWAPKREGWVEGDGNSYLSVNAASLEPRQEGLDLSEWTEKGWIVYLDMLDEKEKNRLGKPHVGGMY
ncbi:hypothetical protein PVAG01_04701 [Phlyctema vagabunda]|uniref:CENP-V/GFA domain-containing protein n=1 Tax=Phlyctema vagabunda TaxID=108571 RepID=A0ABR4PHZ3_9HELO